MTRSIPTDNMDGMTDLEVLDAGGRPLPQGDGPGTWSASQSGGRQNVTVNFDLTDTTGTWTFHYRAQSVVMFFDQGDELRWYVFDAETPVPINTVKATVTLPDSVSMDQMTQAVQSGPSVQTNVTSPGPSTMVYQATGVPPYTNFWIVTGFPKGVVEFTWTARRVAAFIVPKVGFALPIIAFLAMLLLWRRRGRDDPSAIHAKYVSEPPSDLSPGLVGALIDEKVDTKEVVATIVDLARRGYLEIADTKKDGIFSKSREHLHASQTARRAYGVREQGSGILVRFRASRHRDHGPTQESLLRPRRPDRRDGVQGDDRRRTVLRQPEDRCGRAGSATVSWWRSFSGP